MSEVQAIFEFVRSGGAMAVILVVGYGLLSGRLRLGREIDRAEKLVEEAKEDQKFLRERLLFIVERQQTILEELKIGMDRNSRG